MEQQTFEKLASTRSRWTPEEDFAVVAIMNQAGEEPWSVISHKLAQEPILATRSIKQCRERWRNQLDPSLSKRPWTEEDLLTLFTTQQAVGNKWTLVQKALPGRSENSIKNQFYSRLRKQYKKWKGPCYSAASLHKHAANLTSQIVSGLKKRAKPQPRPQPRTLDQIDPVLDLEFDASELA